MPYQCEDYFIGNSLRGATTFSKLGGVKFLGLGYYYPSIEKKLDRSTQCGAVGYKITLYSSKNCKKLGGPSKFWGSPDPSGCANEFTTQ